MVRQQKKNHCDERLRIVEAAASIIKEDIRSITIVRDSYPPPGHMLDDINKDIPKTLTHFLHELIMKNKKGETKKIEAKSTAIAHAIMNVMRPRSFSSQLLLSLSVFLHRRYASKRLLDILSSFGFSAPYSDAVTYEVSTVYHPQPRILPQPDVILQYAADNADINVSTTDGHNTVHIMGVISIISPSNAVVADMPIVKCKSKPNAKDLAAVSHVPLLTYENNGVVGMSKIIVKEIDYNVTSNEPICSKVDLLWTYAKWRDVKGLSGWNGFLEKLTKNNKDFTTSTIMFLPFIHHPASSKDTIYPTLDCAVRGAKSHGQNCYIITFDQPLFYKVRENVAAADIQSLIYPTLL